MAKFVLQHAWSDAITDSQIRSWLFVLGNPYNNENSKRSQYDLTSISLGGMHKNVQQGCPNLHMTNNIKIFNEKMSRKMDLIIHTKE